MDLATLLRKVQRRFGDSAQVFITEADVIDWVNDGQLTIARETKCLSLTVSNPASSFPIAKPTDLLKIQRVTYNGSPINFCDIEDLDSKYLDLSVKETPVFYYFNENQICLYPDALDTDSTAVKITYARIPASIAVIGDALTIPTAFHEDLVSFVLIRAHERNENWKAVEMITAEFQRNLSNRLEDTNVPDDTYPVVRDDPGYSTYVISDSWW